MNPHDLNYRIQVLARDFTHLITVNIYADVAKGSQSGLAD